MVELAGQLIMISNIDSGKRWIIYHAAKIPISPPLPPLQVTSTGLGAT